MIVTFFLNILFAILNILFSWLPRVETLPTINGFNVDTALVTFAEYWHYFADALPPIATLLYALLFFYSYKLLMLILRFTRIYR